MVEHCTQSQSMALKESRFLNTSVNSSSAKLQNVSVIKTKNLEIVCK